MKPTHRLSAIAAALVVSVSFARGQEVVPDPSVFVGKIADWPAPATWSPGRASEGISTMAAVTSPLPFIGLTPCRVADTRGNGAPIQGGIFPNSGLRNWDLTGICGIPAGANAVSVNFSVVSAAGTPQGAFLLAWPTGSPPAPGTITAIMTYGPGVTIISNAAIVPLGPGETLTVNVSHSTHVIMDVNGYYAPAGVGTFNTFLGLGAGNFTMTGDNNTGLGNNALISNTTGDNNTATGSSALSVNATGDGNTAVGLAALASNTDGSNNIGIGYVGGINLTTGNNNICIGNSGANGESNTIRIGTVGNQTATFIAGISGAASPSGVAVFVTGTGKLGTVTSSRRFKEDIREIDAESDGLMSLRPVAFKYKPQIDPEGLAQYGLIAEEVANVYPDLVAYDRDGRPETVRYHLVNALLLNEVQKQHRAVEAQEKTIEQQKTEIDVLKARLSRLETRLLADSRP